MHSKDLDEMESPIISNIQKTNKQTKITTGF